jgi:hypothetical protein
LTCCTACGAGWWKWGGTSKASLHARVPLGGGARQCKLAQLVAAPQLQLCILPASPEAPLVRRNIQTLNAHVRGYFTAHCV